MLCGKVLGLQRQKEFRKITILGDSMLMIRAIIKQSDIGNKVFPGVISRTLSLLAEFEEYSAFHIKHEYNNEADQWEKHGSTLGEGEIIVNGERDFFHIP
jgi:hypothetical protein